MTIVQVTHISIDQSKPKKQWLPFAAFSNVPSVVVDKIWSEVSTSEIDDAFNEGIADDQEFFVFKVGIVSLVDVLGSALKIYKTVNIKSVFVLT